MELTLLLEAPRLLLQGGLTTPTILLLLLLLLLMLLLQLRLRRVTSSFRWHGMWHLRSFASCLLLLLLLRWRPLWQTRRAPRPGFKSPGAVGAPHLPCSLHLLHDYVAIR